MKIVITDAMTVSQGDIDLNIFSKYGDLTVYQSTFPEELSERIKEADAVICNKTVFDKKILSNAKKLKLICLFATGYNNIDTEYCHQNGITVCNAGSYSTNAVAQHTFAMILEFFGRVGNYSDFVKNGGWSRSKTFSPFVFPTYELYNKTIGIIGYGSIGKKVADIALAFDMKVKVFTRTVKKDDRVDFVSFDELISTCDIISVHTPLNKETENMFTYEVFCKCKENVLYVNTARGAINDEEGLIRALKDKKIAGACIDVLASEPMNPDCKLTNIENLIITPHIAWAPYQTRKRLISIVDNNIKNFIEGTPTNVVS